MGRPAVPSGKKCYHCGSMETCKRGFHRQKQRYLCRGCNRGFRDDPEIRENTTGYRRSPNRKLPSAGHLILELHTIAQRIKRTPTVSDIKEQAGEGRANSIKVYYAVFGSYREAIAKARLTPRYPNKYDRKKMLEQLRAFRKKLGRPLFINDIRKAGKKKEVSPYYHYQEVFGSVGKAIKAAGAGRGRECDRWEMIRFLQELDAKLRRVVIEKDISKEFQQGRGPSGDALVREFGSLQAARRVAGIRLATGRAKDQKQYGRGYTEEELIARLKKIGLAIGRRPSQADVRAANRRDSGPDPTTYMKRFGSFVDACRKAGFVEIDFRTYTDRDLEAYLGQLIKKLRRFPTAADMDRESVAGNGPCATTVLRRLGRISKIKRRFSRLEA